MDKSIEGLDSHIPIATNAGIIWGDNLKTLERLPPGYFSLVFADPPFNLGKAYANSNDKLLQSEYWSFTREWIEKAWRLVAPNGSIIIHHIPKWLMRAGNYMEELGAHFRHWIVWDALGERPLSTYMPAHYGFLWMSKSDNFIFNSLRAPHKTCRHCHQVLADYGGKKAQMHPQGPSLSDVWTDIHRLKHKKNRDKHPCQLPLPLMERIIKAHSNPYDTILDPFAGSGTTLLAAAMHARNSVGIEISREYCDLASERLKHEQQILAEKKEAIRKIAIYYECGAV